MAQAEVRKRGKGGAKKESPSAPSKPDPSSSTASPAQAPAALISLRCGVILCVLSLLAILVALGVLATMHLSFGAQFTTTFSSPAHDHTQRTRARPPREHRTQDLAVHVQISLEDAYFGHAVHFPRTRTVVCSTCEGNGLREGAQVITCPHCHGRGFEVFKQRMGHITFDQRMECSRCGGAGVHVSAEDRCPHCGGVGVHQKNEELELQLPPGIEEGGRVILEGKANEHPEANPGDLHVQISTQPHSVFTRRDQIHLDTTLEISLLESLTGFQRKIRHLSGEIVTIRRTDVSHHGQILSFPGKGMPVYQGQGKGDMYAHIRVKFPASLGPAQSERVRSLLTDVEFSNEDRDQFK